MTAPQRTSRQRPARTRARARQTRARQQATSTRRPRGTPLAQRAHAPARRRHRPAQKCAHAPSRRQPNSCCGLSPCRRATSDTLAPGVRLSTTMRALSSSDHRRRRPVPVISSIRRTDATASSPPRRACFQAYAQAYGQIDRSWPGIKPRIGLPKCGDRAPLTVEPCERSLDNPSTRQNLETFRGIGSFDDFKGPGPEFRQGVLELVARIGAVSEDVAQPRIERPD